MKQLFVIISTLSLFSAYAKDEHDGVRFEKRKKIDFEFLLIEGENKRPEISVVTGNLGEDDLGLLKIRENFHDMMADDAGEEIQ